MREREKKAFQYSFKYVCVNKWMFVCIHKDFNGKCELLKEWLLES